MLGSSSLFGKRKREESDQQQIGSAGSSSIATSSTDQQQPLEIPDSASLDEESLQIVEYFERRDADQQKLIDELTKEMEELSLEKSMENFMSKLMGGLSLDTSDKNTSSSVSVLDDKRLKQIKRMQLDESVVLNVGGRLFYSTMKTLTGEGHLVQNSEKTESQQENDQAQTESNKGFDNLFKVMFSSTFQIQYDNTENGTKAINFEDRNPDNFEYVIEHLRANGKVKCLGLEDLSIQKLKDIKDESEFFLTEKLTKYIDQLIPKKMTGQIPDSLIQAVAAKEVIDKPIPIKTSLPVEWLEQFKKIDLDSKERMFKLIDTTKSQINLSKQQIAEFSNSLRDRLLDFMSGNNESDLSIKLEVSGTCFNIPFRIFKEHKEFIVYDFILSENFALSSKGTVFIDRNPELFQIIYSYLMSGNFNNFPVLTPSNKKRLKHEAQFYRLNKLVREYFDECRYPIETIGAENIKIKEQEDYLRELFVKDRNNQMLDDKYLLLAPIFAMRHQIDGTAKDKYKIPNCPKLLNFSEASSYSRVVSVPVMVKSIEEFKLSWNFATGNLLEGLDWNNVFAAGGMVLGCLLDGKKFQAYRTYGRYQTNTKKVNTKERDDSDNEEEGFEEPKEPEDTTKNLGQEVPSSTEYMSFPFSYQYSDHNFAQNKNRVTNLTYQQQQVQHPSLYGTQSIFGATANNSSLLQQQSLLQQTLQNNQIGLQSLLSSLSTPPTFTTPTMITTTPAIGSLMPTMHTMPAISSLTMPGMTTSLFSSSSLPQTPVCTPPSEFENSDIDLFLYALTPEQAEDKLRHIYQVIKNNSQGNDVLVVRTQFAVTFYANKTIQVILRLYKSPAEILLGFDICAACVGYDGSQVWSNARARRALAQKTNLIDPDRMSTSYEARLYKYARRGFSVSVPGYDPEKIKNHFLMFPRTYRTQHIDVQGLAKILLMDYANKSPKTSYILSEFERTKALHKQIERERLMKYFDKDFKSDYDDIPWFGQTRVQAMYGSVNAGQIMYHKFQTRVQLFQSISKIPNWKPYYIFSLNDVETIINDTTNSSNLSEKISWISVNPGSQKIGSFKPVMTNFYSDAYNYATSERPTKTRKKRSSENTYKATWSWEKNISAHTYENYSSLISNKIEMAYRKYCDSVSYLTNSTTPTTVPIMDNYHIDFTTMQQINSSDPSRRRKVQRQTTSQYSYSLKDVPVGELSSKTWY